jgi:GMP synthase-like glutamine amidotransferase
LLVGLLECDHVDERFRDASDGDYLQLFARLFGAHAPDLELRPYDVIGGELPAAPDECDGWVCTGSRHSAYDDLPWIAGLLDFIRAVAASGRPYVGICFGHQALAQALGGRVERSPDGWGAGVRPLALADGTSLRLHFMHQDQVVELPPGGEALGSADHCPVAVLAVGDRLLGIQAHPEFTDAYTEALLVDRELRIGVEATADAMATLGGPTDDGAAARWIGRFLAQEAPAQGS